jgi:hypothetical protein
VVNSVSRRRELDEAAEIHHADAVAHHVPHDREVVADEQVGQPELALQVLHQVQDLRLHRDVERRGRLVADQELGVGGQRARDRDALALAAREFVREFLAVGGERPTWAAARRPAPRSRPASVARPKARIGSAMMSRTRQRGLRLA